jgi:hypothetical protein
MPVTTRSAKNRAQQIRNETYAANALVDLSLLHPDFITPPSSPRSTKTFRAPPAPRRRVCIKNSSCEMSTIPSPPVLRRFSHSSVNKDELEALPHKVTHVNLTMREIVEMRRSSERLISLLNEIETQYLTSHMNTASHN